MRNAKIIVVDDNEAVLRSLRTILSHEFKTIVTVSSPVLLPALLRNGDVDMVLLDMNFGAGKQSGGEGLFWLDRILELKNPPAVILITAFGNIELAVSSLKRGASDFIVKPWDNEKLIQTLVHVWEHRMESNTDKVSSVAESLINALLKKYTEAYAKPLPRLTAEAVVKLSDMAGRVIWPCCSKSSNVRSYLWINAVWMPMISMWRSFRKSPILVRWRIWNGSLSPRY